jgi:glycosyltransferase involved in cell wall biosynthesis
MASSSAILYPPRSSKTTAPAADETPLTRSVLYLAYFFPPRGGAAVQRSLKFARYLPQFGWRPLVVANGGTTVLQDNATKVQDPTLLNELPECAVVRYTTLTEAEKHEYDKAQSKWRQRLNVTDPMGWWCGPAVRAGMELVREYKPQAIVVTMSPFTAAVCGVELKKRTGLPLVFDLRDPWALDETRIYPTRWHGSRDWVAMSKALAAADLVVMNTPQAAVSVAEEFANEIQGRGDACPSKVIAITNGYDGADFAHNGHSQPAAPQDVLRIVHTGMFHSELAEVWDDVLAGRGFMNRLKYPRRPINLWTRTPRYLLRAMEAAVKRGDIPDGKIELVLVGEITDHDRELIAQSPVAKMVQVLGYRTHAESVSWLQSADLLFLPNHTPLDGGPTLVVPGKTYEYLGSGRPILAMCPQGDMRDFVLAAKAGVVVGGEDVEGATRALVDFYRAKQEGRAPVQPERAMVERFERRELTRKLAAGLDELVGTTAGVVARSV